MIDLCAARREFDRYLDLFCLVDEEIKLKQIHT